MFELGAEEARSQESRSNRSQNPKSQRTARVRGLGERVLSEMMPLPFISISRLLSDDDGIVFADVISPGRTMPRMIRSSCWLFIEIWRSASITMLPLASTAIICPVRLVENVVFFPGDFLDPVGLFSQLLQRRVLARRDPMHPPEANAPAAKADDVYEIEEKATG